MEVVRQKRLLWWASAEGEACKLEMSVEVAEWMSEWWASAEGEAAED